MIADRKATRREQIIALCKARGIKVEQRGIAFALIGHGVSLLVVDLGDLDINDLKPYQQRME